MKRSEWRAPTGKIDCYLRASGRRRYNAERFYAAFDRRHAMVAPLIAGGLRRGDVTRIAERLGVSKSTISRDIAMLRRLSMRKTVQPN